MVEQNRNREHNPDDPFLRVVGRDQLQNVIQALPLDRMVFLLFGGDRFSCCDEGIVMTKGDAVIGLGTIAPYGEGVDAAMVNVRKMLIDEGTPERSLGPAPTIGQPTIVGVYVLPEERQKGYGKRILERTIERCTERGFEKVRVDAVTPEGQKTIDSLSEETKQKLEIHDQSGSNYY